MKAAKVMIVLALCALSYVSQAQNLFFGLKYGLNVSKIKTGATAEPTLTTKDYVGYNMAMWFSQKLKDDLRLNIEPGYITKGTSFEGEQFSYRFAYVDLPIMVEYFPVPKLSISAGPNFSYLLNAYKIEAGSKTDLMPYYNEAFEISAIGAIHYELTFFLDIGVRYNYGLTPISNVPLVADPPTATESGTQHNRFVQFALRFKIAN